MLYHFGMMAVAAARAAGILPLGSVGAFADFRDLEGYRDSLRRSRKLGFACTACIHPAHVPIINAEYGPAPEEVDRAPPADRDLRGCAGAGPRRRCLRRGDDRPAGGRACPAAAGAGR